MNLVKTRVARDFLKFVVNVLVLYSNNPYKIFSRKAVQPPVQIDLVVNSSFNNSFYHLLVF